METRCKLSIRCKITMSSSIFSRRTLTSMIYQPCKSTSFRPVVLEFMRNLRTIACHLLMRELVSPTISIRQTPAPSTVDFKPKLHVSICLICQDLSPTKEARCLEDQNMEKLKAPSFLFSNKKKIRK